MESPLWFWIGLSMRVLNLYEVLFLLHGGFHQFVQVHVVRVDLVSHFHKALVWVLHVENRFIFRLFYCFYLGDFELLKVLELLVKLGVVEDSSVVRSVVQTDSEISVHVLVSSDYMVQIFASGLREAFDLKRNFKLFSLI